MTTVTLIGPGAIGCAVAGALVDRDDIDLTIAARTPFAELRIDGLDKPLAARPRVETDPAALEPADIVLLVTKTHQTAAAVPWLDASCGPGTTVAVLQNGIGQRELVGPLVAPRVAEADIVPTIVFLPADRITPGHITIGLPATLQVPDDEPGRRVAELFRDTYVGCNLAADFHTTAWSKLIANCAVGAITVLTRTTNKVLADPEARELALTTLREVIAVAMADGAALTPELAELTVDIVIERASDHVSSQTTDRLAGSPSEWDARQGEVLRRAERHGVDTPLLRTLTTLIRLGEPSGGE